MEKVRKPVRELPSITSLIIGPQASNATLHSLKKIVDKNLLNESPSYIRKNENSKSSKEPFSCNCGPDFYNVILGPTADEAILKGIRAIINIFKRLYTCDPCDKTEDKPEPTKVQKSAPEIVAEIIESIGIPPDVASAIVQTSFAELEKSAPDLASKILQTSTPDMVSQILQTIGLSADMISGFMQTSFIDVVPEGPVMVAATQQTSLPDLKVGTMQTSSLSLKSMFMQTSEVEIPVKEPSKEEITPPVKEPSKEEIKEPKKPKKKKVKKCVCCKCVSSEDETSEESIDKEKETNSTKKDDLPSKSDKKKRKMCVCCKCVSSEDESSEEVIKKSLKVDANTTKDDDTEVPTGTKLNKDKKKKKMCICCKCVVSEDECSEELTPSYSVRKRIREKERLMQVAESPLKMRICKCFEYSSIPVTCRKSRGCLELIDEPSTKPKCVCFVGSKRPKHTNYAKGDTCHSADFSCCCGSSHRNRH